VDLSLAAARAAGASDIHLNPTSAGLEMRWRIDGVLHEIANWPAALAPKVAARLKVMSDLLTYRKDVPQEGRIKGPPGTLEMRVSAFPTLHGEKVVVRLFAETGIYSKLDELGLPDTVRATLGELLRQTSGLLVIAGPAGGGKTTTLYACLRQVVGEGKGPRSVATLEDPIEVAVNGVAQSQVNLAAGFDLAMGLRALMRQDPEVIAVGEMRDRTTSEVALGAALTGHLVLTTFHAASAAGVLGRLLDMGIEPYVLRSGLIGILAQRLVRRLCGCRAELHDSMQFLGLPVACAWTASGCARCQETGYLGRVPVAELLLPGAEAVGRAILDRRDVASIEAAAKQDGLVTRWDRAIEAVQSGITSPLEIRRALGFDQRTAAAPDAPLADGSTAFWS
jgi:type II secretory ATPase GspE/PulE/Tfp pilus assembly ATPase PilB-like protein